MDMINKFSDEYKFLSNFYSVDVIFEGKHYASVEHAYQASKNDDLYYRAILRQPKLKPGRAKELGKQKKLLPGWENKKVNIMYDLLIQKFNISELKDKLLNTGNEELIEDNHWHDNFWGRCFCELCCSLNLTQATNMLGKLLMKIRTQLNHEKTSNS